MAIEPLQAILDVDVAVRFGHTPAELMRAYLDGGAMWVQVRAKQLASGALLDLAESCVRTAEPYGALVLVNDRADIARLSGAAGVHVGQDDLPPVAARQIVGDGAIVGLSTHTLAQVEAALRYPINYIAVGPVFATDTKETGYTAVGLTLVREAARIAGAIPIVAIGGITLERAPAVLEAGARSVAVIGDLMAAGTPKSRTRAYLQHLAPHRI